MAGGGARAAGGGGGGGGLRTALAERWEPMRRTLAELFEARRQLVLGCGLMLLQQLCGINTIMYYSSSILLQARIGTKEH